MNNLFLVYLSLTVSGTLLALVLLLLEKLLDQRCSKRWHYYVWLIVVLRLLIPLTPETNLTGYLLQQVQAGRSTEGSSLGVYDNTQLDAGVTDTINRIGHDTTTDNRAIEDHTDDSLSDLLPMLWIVWLAGASAFLIKSIAFYHRFRLSAEKLSVPNTDPALKASYQDVCARLRIRRPPPVRVSEHLVSPMLVGLFRPFIVMPMRSQSDLPLEYALSHELIHYKRGDMYYKWLVQLARCLHWYNPLIACIARTVSRYCELACDEAVIRGMDEEQKYQYGETLLASVQVAKPAGAIASFPMSVDARQIEERLDSIAQYREKTKLATCISLILAAVLATGGTVMGAYAAPVPQIGTEPPHPAVLPNDADQADVAAWQLTESTDSGSVDFHVLREHFYGTWASNEIPAFTWTIDKDCMEHNLIMAAYMDEGGNAVMEVAHGGVLDRYRIDPGEPDVMLSLGGDSPLTEFTPEFTRITENGNHPIG